MARTARPAPCATGPVVVLLAVLLALLSPPVHGTPHPSPAPSAGSGAPRADDGHDHVRPAVVRGQGDAPAERPATPAEPASRYEPHSGPAQARAFRTAALAPDHAHPAHAPHRRAPPPTSGI
ncbi:hypothetical protein [Streptomyces nigra]|uniref:hypothetical protein n=1 Tax=Streptomyces nigra TaxID=1827580 RepID=UPI000D529534|nr:hypothetical protein [Streptomyces nigra]AWE54018.1 hypothetical protein DC008_32955 [Streptomyces nigra]